jgi:hypothetical protein
VRRVFDGVPRYGLKVGSIFVAAFDLYLESWRYDLGWMGVGGKRDPVIFVI